MVNLPEVQDRSRRVFEDLLRQSGRVPPAAAIREPALAPAPPPEARVAPSPARFSVFDPEQAAAAAEFALGLAMQAAAASDLAEGLDAALSLASQAAQTEDPELVHYALSLFVTHSKEGRRLVKPRIAFAEPRKLAPSTLAAPGPLLAPEAAAGSTGDERRLDFSGAKTRSPTNTTSTGTRSILSPVSSPPILSSGRRRRTVRASSRFSRNWIQPRTGRLSSPHPMPARSPGLSCPAPMRSASRILGPGASCWTPCPHVRSARFFISTTGRASCSFTCTSRCWPATASSGWHTTCPPSSP